MTSRRAPVLGVIFITQLVGLVVAAAIALVRAEPFPGGTDLVWSIVCGLVGTAGIVGLYQGLSVGRMGVVAPVTGVLGATIPAVVGIAFQGSPPPPVLVGIVVAIAAVVLVSRAAGAGGTGRSGIEFALVAGACIGAFNVAIAQVSAGLVFGPIVVIRVVDAVLVGGLLIASRSGWRPSRPLLPVLLAIGILDMTGNAMYILAAQSGPLAVAAVLSSLYPVTTVILATLVLREPVTRVHAAGIALAAAAIALIAGGTTA
ncbi:MAG: EamA family transporter [Chloroflexota bacterium]